MLRAGIKEYDIIIMGNTKTPHESADETKYQVNTSAWKIINNIRPKQVISLKDHTICFQITAEAVSI